MVVRRPCFGWEFERLNTLVQTGLFQVSEQTARVKPQSSALQKRREGNGRSCQTMLASTCSNYAGKLQFTTWALFGIGVRTRARPGVSLMSETVETCWDRTSYAKVNWFCDCPIYCYILWDTSSGRNDYAEKIRLSNGHPHPVANKQAWAPPSSSQTGANAKISKNLLQQTKEAI